MLDHALDEDKRRPHIDVDRVIELLQRNVPDLCHTLAIPGVGQEDVRSLSMLLVDLLEHALDLLCGSDIDLVHRDSQRSGVVDLGIFRFDFLDQCVDSSTVAGICQRQMNAFLSKVECAFCSNPTLLASVLCILTPPIPSPIPEGREEGILTLQKLQ